MLELARERGVRLPADDVEHLTSYMVVREGRSLPEYLDRFEVTLSIMQDAPALERIAYELALDHADENVRWLEVRFCPALSTKGELSSDEVVEAIVRGLRRAESERPIRAALIVCTLRTFEPRRSVELAELALAYHGAGVCGFDIAGAEEGHPVREHGEAFRVAHEAGLPITIHAGEAFGPSSIRQALEIGHAVRIGHGTRLREDEGLLETVRRRRIPLEVCLTSNVQTGAVEGLGRHPALRYHRAGVPVALCTDNRLMSGVTLVEEYDKAHGTLGFTWPELTEVARTGFRHAFVPEAERWELLRAFEDQVTRLPAD